VKSDRCQVLQSFFAQKPIFDLGISKLATNRPEELPKVLTRRAEQVTIAAQVRLCGELGRRPMRDDVLRMRKHAHEAILITNHSALRAWIEFFEHSPLPLSIDQEDAQ
jgi:hypothetical protein